MGKYGDITKTDKLSTSSKDVIASVSEAIS